MRLIVADTSPLVYLLLIDHIAILPQLFEAILVPNAVFGELRNPRAPGQVQAWAADLPNWVEIKSVPDLSQDAALQSLGAGERAAISLALSIHADLVLMDERKGTQAALDRGLDVAGTLGVLQRAARRGLIDLADAFEKLKRTNFRYRQEIMDNLLNETGRH